ncbi:hypothetical protein [Thermococcus sp. JCM 11816]|uniref:hypothetical protein n=1 Tax=Thermococcus sp. (strain JCM 11816 / KS-1) TaxID=1295125 RepID=UPI0006D12107
MNKYLKPASRINETSKDNIVIEVRYYKDSARTQLIGTDTFNIQANWYIQNADYTWTSSTYTNEADIVYEKWDTAISNLGTGIRGKYDLLGDYGRVTFTLFDYMQYSSTYYYSGKTTNTILRTEGIYLQGTASYSTSISRFDAPAGGKIVVYMFHHNGYSTDYAGYSPPAGSSSFTTVLKVPTSNTSPYKVVLPVDDTPAGHKMYTANTFPVYTYLENIYVFNPLP